MVGAAIRKVSESLDPTPSGEDQAEISAASSDPCLRQVLIPVFKDQRELPKPKNLESGKRGHFKMADGGMKGWCVGKKDRIVC